MGGIHPLGLLFIAVVALIIFGKGGRISAIMGDMGKGITSFKKGLKDEVDDTKDAAEEALDVTPPKKASKKGKKK